MEQAKTLISLYGNGIAVGLNGTREQIERSYNRFFNWGAAGSNANVERTSGDSEMQHGELGDSYLHHISDTFAYFLSTEKNMLHALTYENMTKWQDTEVAGQYKTKPRNHKKQSGKTFREHASIAAQDEYNSFEFENFMLYDKAPTYIYQQLDGGAPSWRSETED
jgi:hypothetical protein